MKVFTILVVIDEISLDLNLLELFSILLELIDDGDVDDNALKIVDKNGRDEDLIMVMIIVTFR